MSIAGTIAKESFERHMKKSKAAMPTSEVIEVSKKEKADSSMFAFDEVEKLAEKLTFECGAKVRAEGGLFYADLSTNEIVIPAMPIKNKKVLDILKGGVYHESGHINWTRNLKPSSFIEHFTRNAFEDIRIEANMVKWFKEAQGFLDKLYDYVFEKNIELEKHVEARRPDTENWPTYHKLLCLIITVSRGYKKREKLSSLEEKLLKPYESFLGVPKNPATVDERTAKFLEQVKKDPQFEDLFKEHEKETKKVDKLLEKEEELKELIKKMKDEFDEKQAKLKEKKKALTKEKAKLEEKKETARLEGKDAKALKEFDERIEAIKEKIKKINAELKEAKEAEGITDLEKDLKEVRELIPKYDHVDDFVDLLNEEIIAEANIEDPECESRILPGDSPLRKVKAHIPYTKKFDETNYIYDVDEARLALIQNDAQKYISHLSNFLKRFMKVRYKNVDIRGMKRGKLDRFRLHREDMSIFKQTEERIQQDTAVSIVIDQSGSMLGPPIQNARTLAYTLSTVMGQFKIPHEVVSYAATKIPSKFMKKMASKKDPMINKFARFGYKLVHNVLKDWKRKDATSLSVLRTSLKTASTSKKISDRTEFLSVDSQNVDNESVVEIAKRLLSRQEKRKIMFVLTDGMPMCPFCDSGVMMNDLHMKIKELEMIGVEVVCFGLNTAWGASIYPRYVNVENLENLLTYGVEEFKRVLVPAVAKAKA